MGWPYHFLTLSQEEVLLRRSTIDYYASVAHYSALAPAVVLILLRLIQRAARPIRRLGGYDDDDDDDDRGQYAHVPGTPTLKARHNSTLGTLAARWRAVRWWFGDDVVLLGVSWGQRDEWLLGLGWMSWLLMLCVLGTGEGQFCSLILFHTVTSLINFTMSLISISHILVISTTFNSPPKLQSHPISSIRP